MLYGLIAEMLTKRERGERGERGEKNLYQARLKLVYR
jgi:hypothetical protein